jgi:DNA-binding NtrC family response regulator
MQSLPVFVYQKKLPNILITNNTNRKTRLELENKCFHVMEKPVDPEELVKKVEKLLP